jgi:hypothetical protein
VDTDTDDPDHWDPHNLIDMIRRSVDDTSGYLIAFNVATPAELRAMSYPLGVGHIDGLRDLTLAVTVVARNLDATRKAALTEWIDTYRSRNSTEAVAAYLHTIGRTRDDH